MPRYTDIDKLIAEYDRVHIGPAGGARKLMVEAPIADVVPRADFNKAIKNFLDAQDKVISEAKTEVAREIFEETMRAMESGIAEADKAVINNISVLDFRESLCRAGEMYAGYIGMAICRVFQKYAEEQK